MWLLVRQKGVVALAIARYVGIGVSEYDKGHKPLGHAVPDVEAFKGLVAGAFDCTVLVNPSEQEARECLKGCCRAAGAVVPAQCFHPRR
jgi:hypothetical protein